jgi:hypothetical protein
MLHLTTTFDAARELDVGIYDGLLTSQRRLDDTSDASQVAQAVRLLHEYGQLR